MKDGDLEHRRRRFRGPASRFLLLTCVLAALAGTYAWRFHQFTTHLIAYSAATSEAFATRSFPGIEPDQIVQIGAAHTPENRPSSSYILADTEKAAGVFRIGVFGCSFVRGAEAPEGLDPITQLGRQLSRSEGADKVEVLNFGVDGFGLQQSVLLWRAVADDYDLDLTVFSVFDFHFPRDTSFILLDTIYAPVHSRYVVRNHQLEQVRVVGATRGEAAADYFSAFPRWRYLRYDSKAPAQLRALLPAGRTLAKNPWYYRSDINAEVAELYQLLLSKVAATSRRLVVLCHAPQRLSFLLEDRELGERAFAGHSYRLAQRLSGVYMAPENHLSSLGYHWLAREMAALVEGRQRWTVPLLRFAVCTPATPAGDAARTLDSADALDLRVNKAPFAVLVEASPKARIPPTRVSSKPAFAALIELSEPLSVRLLKSQTPLRDGAHITIELCFAARKERIPLGVLGAPFGLFGRPILDWENRAGRGWRLRRDPAAPGIHMLIATDDELRTASLHIEGQAPLAVRTETSPTAGWRHLVIDENPGRFVLLRAHPQQRLRDIMTDRSGRLDLSVRWPGGRETTIPILDFQVEPKLLQHRRVLDPPALPRERL